MITENKSSNKNNPLPENLIVNAGNAAGIKSQTRKNLTHGRMSIGQSLRPNRSVTPQRSIQRCTIKSVTDTNEQQSHLKKSN